MTRHLKTLWIAAVGALSLHVVTDAFAATAIIAHPGNTVTGLSAEQAAQIYLGRTRTFPDGKPATPVDLPEGSTVREKFITNVLQKNERTLKAYWTKLLYTGKGRPPEVMANDQLVKEWVSKNQSALGYVDGRVLDESVKVLLIVP